MPAFQGSGFTLELPEETVDGSSYVFLLPREGGTAMASVSVRVERRREAVDLAEYARSLRPPEGEGEAEFRVLSESFHDRGAWPYLVSVTDWGEGEAAIRRKEIFVLIAGEPNTVYHLTASERASRFHECEAMLDGILRSFRPNDVQLFDTALG